MLSLKPLTIVGLISYSVYLWHQPIIAFVRLASSEEPHHLTLLSYSLLSLPLGYLSWRYVENVFRNKAIVPLRLCYAIVGVGVGLNLVVGYALYRTYGLQEIWPQYSYGVNPQVYVEEPRRWAASAFRNNGLRRTLVVGNSFARDYINMLRETARLNSMDLVYLDDYGCSNKVSETFATLVAASDLVVFAKNWGDGAGDRNATEVTCSTFGSRRWRAW